MKNLLKLALLLLPMTLLAQSPQIPLTGNIGSGFNGPLINSPAVIFATDADRTMVYPEMSGDAAPLIVTSSVTLTATRNLFVPNTGNFTWPVKNMTTGGQTINVLVTGGTSVPVANGMTVTVVCDGTNCTVPSDTSALTTVTGSGSATAITTGSTVNIAVPNTVANGLTGANTPAGVMTNLTGSLIQYPEWYGAVGNGVHDDTAAIQAAFAALAGGPGSVVLSPGKNYMITGMIDVGATGSQTSSETGVQQRYFLGSGSKITCSPAASLTACVRVMDTVIGEVSGIQINANSNVTYDLEITADTSSTGSTNHIKVSNMYLGGGHTAVGLGPDTTRDVSSVYFYNVSGNGTSSYSWVVGNGSPANVLINYCYGCTSTYAPNGVLIAGGGLSWYGGGMSAIVGADFVETGMPTQTILISGFRGEGSGQFLASTIGGGGGAFGTTISDSVLSTYTNSSGCVVQAYGNQPMLVTNSAFYGGPSSNTTFCMTVPAGNNPTQLTLENVGLDNSNMLSTMNALAANPAIQFSSSNDYQLVPPNDTEGAGSGVTYIPSNLAMGQNISLSGTNAVISSSGGLREKSLSGNSVYQSVAGSIYLETNGGVDYVRLGPTGGVSVGSTAIGTDPGDGNLLIDHNVHAETGTFTGATTAGAGSTDYSTASLAQVAHCLADGTGCPATFSNGGTASCSISGQIAWKRITPAAGGSPRYNKNIFGYITGFPCVGTFTLSFSPSYTGPQGVFYSSDLSTGVTVTSLSTSSVTLTSSTGWGAGTVVIEGW